MGIISSTIRPLTHQSGVLSFGDKRPKRVLSKTSAIALNRLTVNPEAGSVVQRSFDIWDIALGGLYVLVSIGSLVGCVSSCREYQKMKELSSTHQKTKEVKQKILIEGVSFVGAGAFSCQWADKMKWVRLGSALPFFRGVGCLCTLMGSGIQIGVSAKKANESGLSTLNTGSQLQKKRALEDKREALLTLIANVASLAWAILELGSIFVASPLLAASAGGCVLFNLVAVVATIFYKVHIEEMRKKGI